MMVKKSGNKRRFQSGYFRLRIAADALDMAHDWIGRASDAFVAGSDEYNELLKVQEALDKVVIERAEDCLDDLFNHCGSEFMGKRHSWESAPFWERRGVDGEVGARRRGLRMELGLDDAPVKGHQINKKFRDDLREATQVSRERALGLLDE